MKIIGITGGIGSGKSSVLAILKEHYHANILEADKVAHILMQPGGSTYQPLIDAFGQDILAPNGEIDRQKLGRIVFASKEKLSILNNITHPAVRIYILEQIDAYRRLRADNLFVLEAALLIEEGYESVCDEIWYIYADEETRMLRLMAGRGYTKEKCISIFRSQSDENFYRTHCKYVLDNCGDTEKTKIQIDNLLKN